MNSISPEDVRQRRERGDPFTLVDCREAAELEIASIAGALHVPLSDFPQRVAALSPDGDYVIFCHHGVRSQRAAAYLREMGFRNVSSMSGGIDAWSVRIDAAVPRYR